MRRFTVAGIALVALVCAVPAQAQSRGLVELRGGAALPTQDLGDANLNTGGGFGLTVGYRFMPHVLAYGGWDWFALATDGPFEGLNVDVVNTGYAFGLQFQHPMVRSVEGWVRAGALYDHLELEDDEGDIIGDSGHELGWEAGGGLSIPIGNRFAMTPGVRYRTFSGEVDAGPGAVEFDMSYVALEVGISYFFGTQVMAALHR